MEHYNAFLGYDHQSGPRGDDQFNSINWFMLMATKADAENELNLRGMFSLEAATATARGYGYMKSPEELHPEDPVRRTTVSVIR